MSMQLINLVSDQYTGPVSHKAYRELTLQMSSGDFGAHSHESLEAVAGVQYLDHNGVMFYERMVPNRARIRTIRPTAIILQLPPREIGPRQRLLRYQRQASGYIAPVVSLDSYRQRLAAHG